MTAAAVVEGMKDVCGQREKDGFVGGKLIRERATNTDSCDGSVSDHLLTGPGHSDCDVVRQSSFIELGDLISGTIDHQQQRSTGRVNSEDSQNSERFSNGRVGLGKRPADAGESWNRRTSDEVKRKDGRLANDGDELNNSSRTAHLTSSDGPPEETPIRSRNFCSTTAPVTAATVANTIAMATNGCHDDMATAAVSRCDEPVSDVSDSHYNHVNGTEHLSSSTCVFDTSTPSTPGHNDAALRRSTHSRRFTPGLL